MTYLLVCRYLEILIERGMIEAMGENDSSMPSDLLNQAMGSREPPSNSTTEMGLVAEELRAVEDYEDSYGDGGFAAVRGGLLDLLAVHDEEAHTEVEEYTELRLTREERDAEIHILGPHHWDYSKVVSVRSRSSKLIFVGMYS
jgi:hypothetical protein